MEKNEKQKITTPKSSTHIHDRSLSLLSTGASIHSVRLKQLLYAPPAHLSEIMRDVTGRINPRMDYAFCLLHSEEF